MASLDDIKAKLPQLCPTSGLFVVHRASRNQCSLGGITVHAGSRLVRTSADFLADECGAATIEAVLWMPTFAFLLALIADTSLMFGAQAEVLRIVQDANRSMSIGRIMSEDDAETFIRARIDRLSPNATVTTSVTDGVIRTVVDLPSSDLTATGFFAGYATITLRVTAYQLSEA
jgi:Flp pilus assembly protein TadG